MKGPPTCDQCRIEWESVAVLRAPPERPFDFPSAVVRSEKGAYYAVDTRVNELFAFAPSGGTGKAVTSHNAGADRVRTIAPGTGDTVVAFGRSASVFAVAGSFVRRFDLSEQATVRRALAFPRGRFLVLADIDSGDASRYPFHVISPQGAIESSFGASATATFDPNPFHRPYSVAKAGIDQFWANHVNRYRMTLWSTSGRVLQVLEREAEWFSPWDAWSSRLDVFLPPPRLLAVWQDANQRLWTVTSVAASDWHPVPGRAVHGEGPPMTASEFVAAVNTIIEVIDPASGQLIATQRLPQAILGFVGEGLVTSISADREGRTIVAVGRIRLVTQTKN